MLWRFRTTEDSDSYADSSRRDMAPELEWCREGDSNPHEVALSGF